MVAQRVKPVTSEEYLALEAKYDTKSEYENGVIVAMTGADFSHVRITTNILVAIQRLLKSCGCGALGSDMRITTPDSMNYLYPDCSVYCGEPELRRIAGLDALENPSVIFEVLSPTTEKRDRGSKWLAYQTIPSLKSYVLISQQSASVEVFSRSANNAWRYAAYLGLDAIVPLGLHGVELPLAELYEGMTFPEPEPFENDVRPGELER